MGDFQKLDVWKRSHALGLDIYRACERMPARDRYELASQMRRAVISISANIAEGAGRNGQAEFARFLRVSLGSANELTAQLLFAKDLGTLGEDEARAFLEQAARIRKMLSGLIGRLTGEIG